MSDLHCPATLIFARHGEAEYETDTWSDDGGSLTRAGRRQARELAEDLHFRNLAHVYCSTMARAVQTAEIVATTLDLDVSTRNVLRETSIGEFAGTPHQEGPFADVVKDWLAGDLDVRVPGGETGWELVTRLRTVIEDVSDLHRGETVLVVAHGGIMRVALPALANMAPGVTPDRLDNAATVEIQVDADGLVCTEWAARPRSG